MNMKKILFTALLALSFISSCRAQTVFTFECFCGYLTVADGNCDVCGPTLQSRMFTGIIIRRNGVPHKWIETPYTVRFNGQVARFQELVYPNPETINIDRSQTPYSTLDSFKMAIQCPCVGGGGRDTIVIDSSGAVCAALYFFANDTAAIASPTTDQYDYYLSSPENYYGLPAGLVKLAWETTLPDSAGSPGCGSGGGIGTVTSFAFTDGNGFTGTVTNPTTTPTLSLVLQDAAADGGTKGQATFAAADFNSSAGLISLDYTNGQTASGSQPGFLSSSDWSTFNGKLTGNAPITGATKTKITYDTKGLVTAGADATTTDIAEGTNLYYTDERNDDRTAALIQNNTGVTFTYNDGAGTLTPTLSDPSATNEGALSVGAGASNTSLIQSNTSGDLPIVLRAGSNVTLSESGDTITIASSGSGGGDNLGDHTATQDLDMALYEINRFSRLNFGGASPLLSDGHMKYNNSAGHGGLQTYVTSNATGVYSDFEVSPDEGLLIRNIGPTDAFTFQGKKSAFTFALSSPIFNAGLDMDASLVTMGHTTDTTSKTVSLSDIEGLNISYNNTLSGLTRYIKTKDVSAKGVSFDAFSFNAGNGTLINRVHLLYDSLEIGVTPSGSGDGLQSSITIYLDSIVIGTTKQKPGEPILKNSLVVGLNDARNYGYYTKDQSSNIVLDNRAIPDIYSTKIMHGETGNTTGTTDGSGLLTISHSLGLTPVSAIATYQGDNPWYVTVTVKTSTDFTIKVWDDTGAPVASTAVDISWQVK